MPGNFLSGIFMVVWMFEYVYVYELSQEQITNPDGGIWYTRLFSILLHCIRTFRIGFEQYSNVSSCVRTFRAVFERFEQYSSRIKYCIKGNISLNGGLSKSNTARIRLETQTFTNYAVTFTSVHELRQERSGAFTSSIGTFTNYKSRRGHSGGQ